MNLVVVGCSRRKLATAEPVPALELYQGGCFSALRARVGPVYARERVRILSARHGLVRADEPLLPYDQPLNMARALGLQPAITESLCREWARDGWPEEVLAILEPLYMVCLAGILALPGRPLVRWVTDLSEGWAKAVAVLDGWGW